MIARLRHIACHNKNTGAEECLSPGAVCHDITPTDKYLQKFGYFDMSDYCQDCKTNRKFDGY